MYGYGDSKSKKSRGPRHQSQAYAAGGSRGGSDSSAGHFKMNSIRSPDAQSEEGILPHEDLKGSEIWCTTEVHLQAEARKGSEVGNLGREKTRM
jgi:hypothetical protein